MVVGWYHSHPGFGCWLSGVDVNTQQSFEALNQRAVAGVRAAWVWGGVVVVEGWRRAGWGAEMHAWMRLDGGY